MNESDLSPHNDNEAGVTLRDLTAVAFRHRRLISITFLGILSGAILIAVLQPNRYEAALKILVKKDRVDNVVTPDAVQAQPLSGLVTEEELNSEVVLLKSADLLEEIVVACNLQHRSKHTGLGVLATILPIKLAEENRRHAAVTTRNGLPETDMSFWARPVLRDTGIHIQADKTPVAAMGPVDTASLHQQSSPETAMPGLAVSFASGRLFATAARHTT